MYMKRFSLFFAVLATILMIGCSEDDSPTSTTGTLKLSFTGLEDLGSTAAYEGWVIVNGLPVSTGTFSVDANGVPSKTDFSVSTSDLTAATAFVLTIEPVPDNDPKPSATHILAGDFSSSSAGLTIAHSDALGTDFSSATGGYILATPTDGGMTTNENSGVWFLDPSSGTPVAGLSLPTLPAGWKYEGWAVINGTPVTSGTFTSPNGVDDAAPFSETVASGPPFPGEDFLLNAPSGLSFPTDLAGMPIVISVEPDADNSPAPFTLKPLTGMAPANADDHIFYSLTQSSASFPTGTATR